MDIRRRCISLKVTRAFSSCLRARSLNMYVSVCDSSGKERLRLLAIICAETTAMFFVAHIFMEWECWGWKTYIIEAISVVLLCFADSAVVTYILWMGRYIRRINLTISILSAKYPWVATLSLAIHLSYFNFTGERKIWIAFF